MPAPGVIFSFFILLLSFPIIYAYSIDHESCGFDSRVYDMVQSQIESAYTLADDAMAAMEEDPPNKYVLDLADMLFSPQRRARVHRRLSKLAKYKEKVPETQPKDLFDPIFFCTQERIEDLGKTPSGDTLLRDKKGGFSRNVGSDDGYFRMKRETETMWSSTKRLDEMIVATALIVAHEGYRNQVQISPAYLGKQGLKYQGLNDVEWVESLMSDPSEEALSLFGEDSIDNWNLLDHTLLHELTHFYKTDDHNQECNFKACVALSGEDGGDNADSYAYFALGVRLINLGAKITRDGKVLPQTS